MIHSDAYRGNLLRDGHRVVLADGDAVSVGPREIDLIPILQPPGSDSRKTSAGSDVVSARDDKGVALVFRESEPGGWRMGMRSISRGPTLTASPSAKTTR